MTPLTILHHDTPRPDAPNEGADWCGATTLVVGGGVAGELWEFHAADGTITRGVEVSIDGYGGRVRFFDPQTLRDLAAVATALADRLDTPS